MSIEGTRKGKKEVLKLHLIPWQVVQESNSDTGIRVVLEVDGSLVPGVFVRQIKKCRGAYTSTKQVLVQTAKPVPPLGQYIIKNWTNQFEKTFFFLWVEVFLFRWADAAATCQRWQLGLAFSLHWMPLCRV